jgi:hypothetical protein
LISGCTSPAYNADYNGSPMVMVPRLDNWSATSQDFSSSRPVSFQNDMGLNLQFNYLSRDVLVEVRDLDSREVLTSVQAHQPDELSPFYTVRIPAEIVRGRNAIAIDVYPSSRISGYPGTNTLLVSTQGSIAADVTSSESESLVLQRAIEARRQNDEAH